MCVDEETRTKITDICIYYGLDWYETKSGIVVDSDIELWFLKFKKSGKGAVRVLYHQNHGRTSGKNQNLPCIINEIDNNVLHKCFHKHDWNESDIKKTLKYIYNHSRVRRTQA